MKLKYKRVLKMVLLSLVSIVIVGVIIIALLLNYYPAFGGSQSASELKLFEQSGHYSDGRFVNEIPTSLNLNAGQFFSMMGEYITGIKNDKPEKPLPVIKVDPKTLTTKIDSIARLTWFGHSAFLLEIDNKNILLDPMLGNVCGPFSWLGTKRFTEGLPVEVEQLPKIDAVFFSHDHYDHLDYGTILKIKDKVQHFFVPLGVGAHLKSWGVDSSRISELNWWDETKFSGLKLACVPARHFSGRGMLNRNSTLWASWVIIAANYKIYFSGDSGYGPHFKAIGEKYGPFDFAMMECGQYNKRWESIHMMPEQTAQATLDLKAKQMMPIHWGAFVLSLHSWKDPVERLSKKAQEINMSYLIPQIGEQLDMNNLVTMNNFWWQALK
jgi:L-ascorbate metabolism protein UlaG (beta-lactamase superfamily)